MSQLTPASSAVGNRLAHEASTWRDVLTLAKPGIVQMVAITGAVGFTLSLLASRQAMGLAAVTLVALGTLIGIVLSAAGANTLNQAIEHERDARMRRTSARPIPLGTIAPVQAWVVGIAESVLGVLALLLLAGPAPALVSATIIITYLAWYTPLKPRTSWSTLVGAFPGALPPLIGWTAAQGGAMETLLTPAGWALVAIVFVWQMPHFLAIAWLYRADYEQGGYRVLPVSDRAGVRTGVEAVLWAALLIPVSLAPALWTGHVVGPVAVVIAVLGGVLFLRHAVRFLRERTDARAKKLFFASIIYLPVVLVALVADALVHALL
ncbi:MAG: heme o synthase [Phycisphaerales bacterium]